jgi:hypothetical protein
VLRKRPLLVMRGSFGRPELFDSTLLQSAHRQLLGEDASLEREPATLLEMTIEHVDRSEPPSVPEMLKSIQQLTSRGSVIITDYPETYLLSRYLRRHSTEPVRFVLSVAAAVKTMHETFYNSLPGTLLEGLGRLLASNVKLYIAPMPRNAFCAAVGDLSDTFAAKDSGSGLVTLDDLLPPGPSIHLVRYLRASGRIIPLESAR